MRAAHATIPVLALALLAHAAAAQPAPRFPTPSIMVEGEATQTVRPDVATLSLGVVEERRGPSEAAASVARASAAMLAELKSLGVEEEDVRTERVELAPVYAQERDDKTNQTRSALAGYRATSLLSIVVRDVGRAGAIASRLLEKGANTLSAVRFSVSDEEARRDALREKAVVNAKARAALYARGAGMTLGRLLAIEPGPQTGDGAGRATMMTTRVAAGPQGGAALSLEPGVVVLREQASAAWELAAD